MICRASISWRNTGNEGGSQRQLPPLKCFSKRVQRADRLYLSTVISHFKNGRLPANPAWSIWILLSVFLRVRGAAEALPFQFTHPTALYLELGQVRRFGSTVMRKKTLQSQSQIWILRSSTTMCTEKPVVTSAWVFLTYSRCPALWLQDYLEGSNLDKKEGWKQQAVFRDIWHWHLVLTFRAPNTHILIANVLNSSTSVPQVQNRGTSLSGLFMPLSTSTTACYNLRVLALLFTCLSLK